MRLILALLLIQSAAPAAIRDIVKRLRHVTPTRFGTTIVPPAVASDLTALKHSLRDLITQTVEAATDVSPEDLQARVIESLEREDVPVGDEGEYGVISAVKLARPKEYPGWLVASVSLAIPSGDDTSLYVFQIRNARWLLAMIVETDGYDEISGAQGWLEYRVGRSSGGGTPFLVTTEVSPWPTSNWHGLRLRVWQAGRRPDHPRPLVTTSLFYCVDVPYQVAIRNGGFALIYQGLNVDPKLAGYRGIHYLAYSVNAGIASLVKEAAVDPSNLVKRWVGLEWSAASASIKPPSLSVTREWHQRLREPDWQCDLYDMGTLVDGKSQGLLATAACRHNANSKPEGYVLLGAVSQGILIESVSSDQPDWPAPSDAAYYAQDAGATDPIPEHVVQPTLSASFGTALVKMRVSVVVKSDGTVGSVEILDWPDQPGLVIPAIRAVRQWKFKPGTKDGQPVNVTKTVEVVFTK